VASLHINRGDAALAADLFEEVARLMVSILGPDHPA
jgi:hypothetical protein